MTALALFFLIPATVACGYYVGLALVGWWCQSAGTADPRQRIVVLIPAHDEELSLGLSLESIRAAGQSEIVVVADNCTDGTADLARRFGATVLERTHANDRGKGYALRFGLGAILATRPDAVLILDADCQVDADTFRVLQGHLAAGADAVQCAVRTGNPRDAATSLVGAVGNMFDNLLAAGRDRLGWRVPLRGSGMCFRREVLERFPWQEYGLTEDADYSERLWAGGVRVRFEPRPLIRSETPTHGRDLYQQRRRWRAALFGRGFWTRCLESKPLVLAQLTATGGVVVATGLFAVWFAVLVALTVCLYGCVAATVGPSRHLLAAPWIGVRLAWVTLGGFARRDLVWQRTRRAAEVN